MGQPDASSWYEETLATLAAFPLLAGLQRSEQEAIARQLVRRTFAAGEVIIEQADESASLFLIAEGWVQILVNWRVLQGMGEVVLHNLGPGEIFGEIAALDSKPRSASAVGLSPGICYEMRQATFAQLLATSPAFARGMLELLADRVRRADERVLREARDPLTGLPNRGVMDEYYERVASRSQRQGGDVALVLLDVDYLKRINDTQGHDAGDQALRLVAATLRGTLRGGDLAVRWGGDEFAVLLPGTAEQGGHAVMERVRARLAAELFDGGPVGISYGVATAHYRRGEPIRPLEALLLEADQALYAAKERRTSVTPG